MAVPKRATSPAPRPAPPEERAPFAWSGALCGYLRLGRQPARRPPDIRTDSRSELACDAFRSGCCCTLLLYQALEPCGQAFELWHLSWGGAMGIRTPDLLHAIQLQRVHPRPSPQVTVSGRPHESAGIQAGCCTFVLYRSRQQRCILRGGSYLWLAPRSSPSGPACPSVPCLASRHDPCAQCGSATPEWLRLASRRLPPFASTHRAWPVPTRRGGRLSLMRSPA